MNKSDFKLMLILGVLVSLTRCISKIWDQYIPKTMIYTMLESAIIGLLVFATYIIIKDNFLSFDDFEEDDKDDMDHLSYP